MADHFEEVVHLRLHALEARFDREVGEVERHFAELRAFITESLRTQIRSETREMRSEVGELRTGLRGLRVDVGRLEQRLDSYQEATRLEFGRLERRMVADHEATHLALRDILRRLPEAPA